MKNKLIPILFTGALIALVLYSCQKQQQLKTLAPKLPATPYDYGTGCNNFNCFDNTPTNNMLTANGATLGRLLFYDPRLSINNTVSCASCHKQANAFADDATFSAGFEGVITKRNSPAIINENEKSTFFWDGRATSLEAMVLMPVQHNVEMGLDRMDVLEKKIAAISYYPELFKKAFGSEDVNRNRIAMALAQFVRAMRSQSSRVETMNMNQLEADGAVAFQKFQCANCHNGSNFGGSPLFGGYEGTPQTANFPNAANIGLDVVYADKGVKEINGSDALDGAFMIPSLRNLSFTAPYMHDGRYTTLEQVIEHYNSGIQPSATLDHNLINSSTGQPLKMNMTDDEKVALAAFLRALSDPSITTDVRFSNPFN